jgi:predicted transglutaminase-like cysteine proteinase
MLRVLSVMAFICIAGNPVHADGRSSGISAALPQHGLMVKWRGVQHHIAQDEARLAGCRAEPWTCSDAERRFEAIVASGRARQGRAQIGDINRAVNLAIRPVSDERRFGVADRWSSPLETIGDGVGDCEDYAILKLLALREAGVASDDLKLLIVRDRSSRTAHAVAAVKLDGRWLLLDNRRFALVDLEFTHYRLLAKLDPETEGEHHALLDAADADPPREFM